MIRVIETIINEPKALATNSSAVTYDGISTLSRCTLCCDGGYLSYQNGSPLFKIIGNGYTGRYRLNWTGTVSASEAGVVSLGVFEDGVLIPDTLRAVTIASPDDVATISISKLLRLCPKSTTSLSVQSVPAIPTPTEPATPIETVAPILVSVTNNLTRSNN